MSIPFGPLLCGFVMAPQRPQQPGEHVFSLGSSSGFSYSSGPVLDPLDLGGGLSCFAVSGSVAEARNLHRRGRTAALYGGHGPFFVNSGLPDSAPYNLGTNEVYAAASSIRRTPVHVHPGMDNYYTPLDNELGAIHTFHGR